MKSLIVFVILISSCDLLSAQVTKDDKPAVYKDTTITATTRYLVGPKYYKTILCASQFSKRCNLYATMNNTVSIILEDKESRYITINHNYSSDQLLVVENWRPISRKHGWEFTQMTAVDSGAYDENQYSISKQHIDNEAIYWIKDFTITPRIEQDFVFDVYYETDSAFLSAGDILLQALPYPKPVYNVEFSNDTATIQEFLALDSIKTINLSDFTEANNWFGIKYYTITIFNQNHIVVFNETVRSSMISEDAKKVIRKLKNGGSIVIENMGTKKAIKSYFRFEIVSR